MYEIALNILKKLENSGYQAYIVGGYPRDIYCGFSSTDIDICTNASEHVIYSLFDIINGYPRFGTFVLVESGYHFEITRFRKDYYVDSRYPHVEFVSTLEEDLKRRDFIINTLCIDSKGNYVDILNAREDMDEKTIRMIGNPDERFLEDPLRIIRALRIQILLGFELEQNLKLSIIQNGYLIQTLSRKRIHKELEKMSDFDRNHLHNLLQSLDLLQYFE